MKIVAVIPARYGSTRFPGKPLCHICGKPMIQWTYERTAQQAFLSETLVATDDLRIAQRVRAFGGSVVMTRRAIATGTDRIAAALRGHTYDWAFNIQGDEPLIDSALLRAMAYKAKTVAKPAIITAVRRIEKQHDIRNMNVVKVVLTQDGRALYFSRAPIPDMRRAKHGGTPVFFRHIGVYLFHRIALQEFVRHRSTVLERTEQLEQLRALEIGIPIYAVKTSYTPYGVDVPADVPVVERYIRQYVYKK